MSSRRANLRKKPTLSFDDDDGEAPEEEGPAVKPPAAAAALKKKASAQKLSALSFGDDAGDDAGGAKPKAKPRGLQRAPGTAAPPADERAARVYTQVSAAGALLQGWCASTGYREGEQAGYVGC